MNSKIIAGTQKLSLLDYPGHPAAIVFFSGCNMTCPYCHNKEIATRNYPLFSANVDSLVDELSNYYLEGWIEGAVITGGEPCINPKELKHFIWRIKAVRGLKGFKIKLDTNGSYPDILKEIKGDIDYIAMDIKKPFPKNNCKISKSVDIIMGSSVDYEFRTTAFPPWVDEGKIREIGENIKGAKVHYLQQYKAVDDTKHIKPYDPVQLRSMSKVMSEYVRSARIRGL